MRCGRCDQGDHEQVRRAKTAERDGHIAVVLDVPMDECPSCGDRWLRWEVATHLDELLNEMLSAGAEVATRHYDQRGAAPAA